MKIMKSKILVTINKYNLRFRFHNTYIIKVITAKQIIIRISFSSFGWWWGKFLSAEIKKMKERKIKRAHYVFDL